MTRDVETIAEDADLSEAVDRMLRRRIKRLPVLRGETLVGVDSRSDLLKALAGPDAFRQTRSIPTRRSEPQSWRSSTSSNGRRERASASRFRTAPSPSTARSSTNGCAARSRSSPRTRPAASPSTTTWLGSSRTRALSFRRRGRSEGDRRATRSTRLPDAEAAAAGRSGEKGDRPRGVRLDLGA